MLAQVEQAVTGVEAVLASLDPDALDGPLAARYVEVFAKLERLAGAGKTLAARRVVQTRAWKHDGAHHDAAGWLASTSGTTVGQAAAVLETAGRLDGLVATESALRSGELSATQAAAITDAAAADPHAERLLLEHAAVEGVKGLRDECARVKAAARTDEIEHHRRIHERRSLRSFTDRDGAGRIEVRGPVDATVRAMAALEPFEREQFELVRAAGERECADATAFDSLVAMAEAGQRQEPGGGDNGATTQEQGAGERGTDGRGTDERGTGGRGTGQPAGSGTGCRPAVAVNIRVDHAALVRGHTEIGEVCEVVGAGPVPVAVARQLLDDCLLRVLLVDGADVLSVSSARRTIPSRIRAALEELQPKCGIHGCNVSHHLEIDHNVPIEAGGLTELANLNRLCRFHHRYKHEHDLRLEGSRTRLRFVTADGRPPPAAPP